MIFLPLERPPFSSPRFILFLHGSTAISIPAENYLSPIEPQGVNLFTEKVGLRQLMAMDIHRPSWWIISLADCSVSCEAICWAVWYGRKGKEGPASEKWDHAVIFQAKGEIKGQFQVHSSSPGVYLGTLESGICFFLLVFLEKSLRDSPKSGGYDKFSHARGLCSEITTTPDHFCACLRVTNSSRVYRKVWSQKQKHRHWYWC